MAVDRFECVRGYADFMTALLLGLDFRNIVFATVPPGATYTFCVSRFLRFLGAVFGNGVNVHPDMLGDCTVAEFRTQPQRVGHGLLLVRICAPQPVVFIRRQARPLCFGLHAQFDNRMYFEAADFSAGMDTVESISEPVLDTVMKHFDWRELQ